MTKPTRLGHGSLCEVVSESKCQIVTCRNRKAATLFLNSQVAALSDP